MESIEELLNTTNIISFIKQTIIYAVPVHMLLDDSRVPFYSLGVVVLIIKMMIYILYSRQHQHRGNKLGTTFFLLYNKLLFSVNSSALLRHSALDSFSFKSEDQRGIMSEGLEIDSVY